VASFFCLVMLYLFQSRRSVLSINCLFHVFVLESRSHPVDLVLADTVTGGLIAPCRDGPADLLGYLARLGGVQFKVLHHGHGQRQGRCAIILINSRGQYARLAPPESAG